MNQVIDQHSNSIVLFVSVPPPPSKSRQGSQPGGHTQSHTHTADNHGQLCVYTLLSTGTNVSPPKSADGATLGPGHDVDMESAVEGFCPFNS